MATRSAIADQIKADALKQKQDEIARNLWINSSPDIARSYANDPRTQLATNAMSTGSDTSALTGGLTEGIARIGEGVLGGIVSKQQRGKYGAAEGNLENKVGSTLAGTNNAVQQGVAGGVDPNAAAAVASAAGGGNIPVPGAAPPPMPPSAPPPGSTAGIASALMPPTVPPVAPPAAGAAPPVAPPNFSQAPAIGRGVGVRPTVPTTTGITPTTTTGLSTRRSRGGSATNNGSLMLAANDAFGSAIGGGNNVPLRGARDTIIQDSGGLGANLMSGGPSVSTIGPRVAARQAAAPVSGTPDAEARGWLAPRAARNAAQLAGKFGDRDDPYGSYGAVYGNGTYGRPSKPLPDMTVGEVLDFGDNVLRPATKAAGIGRAADGSVVGTSAGGAFQIEGSTLRRLAPKVLGADYRTADYGVVNQDKLGKALFDESKQGNLKAIWTSLPDATPGAYSKFTWDQMKPLIIAGESSVKGGTTSSARSGGGVDAFGVPNAPQTDVAPLPPAPVEPPRPAPRDPITSARLETIQRLLPNVQGLGPGQMGAAVHMADDWYGKGLDQVQEGRMQQDRQEAALTQSAYDTNLGVYGQGNKDLFQQRVGQTTADQAANRANQATQYAGQIAAAEGASKDVEARAVAKTLAETELAKQKAHDDAVNSYNKMSPKDKVEYRGKYDMLNGISSAIAQIQDPKNAKAFNTLEGSLPEWSKQGISPQAVQARAFLANLMGQLRLQRGGTALTANELQYMRQYIPDDKDWSSGAAIAKLQAMQSILEQGKKSMEMQYGINNPGIAGLTSGQAFAPIAAAGAVPPGWSVEKG